MRSIRARRATRIWQRLATVGLAVAVVAAQLAVGSGPARAATGTTGSVTETPTEVQLVNFVDLEVNEVQSVSNDAGGGTFTLKFDDSAPTPPLRYDAELADMDEVQTLYNNASSGIFTVTFDGQGPTTAIDYNASAATVEAALEGLTNVNDVAVSGTGVLADPWVITFLDPGSQDVPEITTDDTGLGGATSTIATQTEGNLSLETALESLTGIGDVSVTGAGTAGDPWLVTFLDPQAVDVPALVADDTNLTPGGSTTTITQETAAMSAPIDPTGVTYRTDVGSLVISDSEIEEEPDIYDGVNLWQMSPTAPPAIEEVGTTWPSPLSPTPQDNNEPNGLAYNPADNGHLYVANDNRDVIRDRQPGPDGIFGTGDDPAITEVAIADLGLGDPDFDPEDVAWDSTDNEIFIAGGPSNKILAISPGPDGVLGEPAGSAGSSLDDDDVVGTPIDLSGFVSEMEGIGYRASSDTLLVTSQIGGRKVFEVTKDGRLIRTIDIGDMTLPGDVVMAPASSGGGDSMYVVDRVVDNNRADPTLRDGQMREFDVAFDNLAPFVDAGPNYSIALSDPLTITGDTYDDNQPSTDPPTVTWSKVSGPGDVTFGSPNALETTVSFSTFGGSENPYVLQLESTDGVETSTDTMQVLVFADAPTNMAPTVLAGSDQTVTLPDTASLDGSVSDDGLPNPPGSLTTTWSKVSGPGTVTFGDANVVDTTAAFSEAGAYVLELTANDSELQTSDTVNITVNPANQAPNVSAGPDQTITLPDSAQLNGSVTDDGLPDPPGDFTAVWSKVSGPGTVTFGDHFVVDTTAGFSAAGTYVLKLTATDGELSASDLVQITVEPEAVSGTTDTFVDDNSSIFESDIEWLAAEGITKGCNPPVNDHYCPNDFVTRGQMAAFLVRAFGYTDDGGGNKFVDDNTSVFEGDIDRLATAGVTKGCNPPVNDHYCPNDFVTRGQMAAFLVRAFGYTDDGGGNKFVDDNTSVFEGDIDRLATAGVTKGCNPPVNDHYCPNDFVTRGQMAAFLHRAFTG